LDWICLGHDPVIRALDQVTAEALQLRAPGRSKVEFEILARDIRAGILFSSITDPSLREQIITRPLAKSLRLLIEPNSKGSIESALAQSFIPAEVLNSYECLEAISFSNVRLLRLHSTLPMYVDLFDFA
jgi:hypothetical protein